MVENRQRIAWDIFIIALLLVPYFIFVFRFNFITDDSFISFRYAYNLVHGHGLRYNWGENPPVEGYSNLLWVLIMAFFMKLGADPTIASRVLSIACGTALIVAFYWTCRRIFRLDRLRTFLGSLVVVLFPPFFVWSTGGLETMAFALSFFLLLIVFFETEGSVPVLRAGVLGIVIMLLRPEGMLYSMLIPAIAAAYYHLAKKPGSWRRDIGCYLIVIFSGLFLLSLWRLVYFRSLLPNTFYAKVGFTMEQLFRGWDYVAHFFLAFPGMLVIMVVSAVSLAIGRVKSLPLVMFLLAVAVIAVPILLGGDFMTMARFLVPLVPIAALLSAVIVFPRPETIKKPVGIALMLGVLFIIGADILPAFNVHVAPKSVLGRVNFRWTNANYISERDVWDRMKGRAEMWTFLGKLLGEMCTPDQSIVTGGIGAVGYYSKVNVYDRYGLVSPEVAKGTIPRAFRSAGHDKSVDAFFFYKYKPDYFHPRLVPEEDLERWKTILMRNILQRSKSRGRRDLVTRFLELKSEYEIFVKPVSYERDGKKMIMIAVKRKEQKPSRKSIH